MPLGRPVQREELPEGHAPATGTGKPASASDQIDDFEQIRDHGLRAVYGNWAFRRTRPTTRTNYANRKLGWVAYVGGKRESRRLLGDVILTQQDVDEQQPVSRRLRDHHLDHRPALSDPVATSSPARSSAPRPSSARSSPTRFPTAASTRGTCPTCSWPAGNISVTHVALGTIRVMRTTGMMGEVVGMAAAVCKKHSSDAARRVCKVPRRTQGTDDPRRGQAGGRRANRRPRRPAARSG